MELGRKRGTRTSLLFQLMQEREQELGISVKLFFRFNLIATLNYSFCILSQ